MANLTVKKLPDPVYRRLKKHARLNGRRVRPSGRMTGRSGSLLNRELSEKRSTLPSEASSKFGPIR